MEMVETWERDEEQLHQRAETADEGGGVEGVCGCVEWSSRQHHTPAHTQLMDARMLWGAVALCVATHAEEEEGKESVRVNE